MVQPNPSIAMLSEYYDALEQQPSSVYIHERLLELWQELQDDGRNTYPVRIPKQYFEEIIIKSSRYGVWSCFKNSGIGSFE
jgi:hypothetical protein